VVARLVEAGVRPDQAVLYSDAFVEFHDASRNIAEHGAIVQHPRTGNPMENPYLRVRDAAAKRLQAFSGKTAIEGAKLW
jgi:phage terminase small subunit